MMITIFRVGALVVIAVCEHYACESLVHVLHRAEHYFRVFMDANNNNTGE